MNRLTYLVSALLTLLTSISFAHAQQIDPPTLQIDAVSTVDSRSIQTEMVSLDLRASETGEGSSSGAKATSEIKVETTNEGTRVKTTNTTTVDGATDVVIVDEFVSGDSVEVESSSRVNSVGNEGEVEIEINEDGVNVFNVNSTTSDAGEKGGTTDMNIGIGELQETTDSKHKDWIIIESMSSPLTGEEMNKADLIDKLANDAGMAETRAIYVKIPPIDGESKDSGSSGASKKKPKEIVVVGSKARSVDALRVINFAQPEGEENAAPDSFFDIWIDAGEERNAQPDSFFDIFVDVSEENAAPDSFFDIFVDVSDEDVQLQALSVAQRDERIEEIVIEEDEVEVEFKQQGKLFGFIAVNMTRTVEVDTDPESDDRVQVKMPWWSFLVATSFDADQYEKDLEAALKKDIPSVPTSADDRPTEEVAFYYNKIQAQTLQTMSNVSK